MSAATGAALEAMIASTGHFNSGVVGLVLGVATFLFLATGAIIELQDDLNIIWKVKPPETYGIRAFVRTRLLSLALIVGFGFLLMVSLVLDAGLTESGPISRRAFRARASFCASSTASLPLRLRCCSSP